MADPSSITANYPPPSPAVPGAVSADFLAGTPTSPRTATPDHVPSVPPAPAAPTQMTASAMVISGDARVSASYGEVTVDESINGVYLNAGVDSNGRPHYSVDGQGAIHGVGFEVFIEYDPGAGWDIKAYQDGSFMTNWDQGYAGTEATPDLVANYGIHSGSNGVPPVVTALAGTPRMPAVLTEDFAPGAPTPPPVITA